MENNEKEIQEEEVNQSEAPKEEAPKEVAAEDLELLMLQSQNMKPYLMKSLIHATLD